MRTASAVATSRGVAERRGAVRAGDGNGSTHRLPSSDELVDRGDRNPGRPADVDGCDLTAADQLVHRRPPDREHCRCVRDRQEERLRARHPASRCSVVRVEGLRFVMLPLCALCGNETVPADGPTIVRGLLRAVGRSTTSRPSGAKSSRHAPDSPILMRPRGPLAPRRVARAVVKPSLAICCPPPDRTELRRTCTCRVLSARVARSRLSRPRPAFRMQVCAGLW